MSLIGFRHAGREERERGNRLFSERNYEEAIGCYTTAIVSRGSPFVLNPNTQSVFDCIMFRFMLM